MYIGGMAKKKAKAKEAPKRVKFALRLFEELYQDLSEDLAQQPPGISFNLFINQRLRSHPEHQAFLKKRKK